MLWLAQASAEFSDELDQLIAQLQNGSIAFDAFEKSVDKETAVANAMVESVRASTSAMAEMLPRITDLDSAYNSSDDAARKLMATQDSALSITQKLASNYNELYTIQTKLSTSSDATLGDLQKQNELWSQRISLLERNTAAQRAQAEASVRVQAAGVQNVPTASAAYRNTYGASEQYLSMSPAMQKDLQATAELTAATEELSAARANASKVESVLEGNSVLSVAETNVLTETTDRLTAATLRVASARERAAATSSAVMVEKVATNKPSQESMGAAQAALAQANALATLSGKDLDLAEAKQKVITLQQRQNELMLQGAQIIDTYGLRTKEFAAVQEQATTTALQLANAQERVMNGGAPIKNQGAAGQSSNSITDFFRYQVMYAAGYSMMNKVIEGFTGAQTLGTTAAAFTGSLNIDPSTTQKYIDAYHQLIQQGQVLGSAQSLLSATYVPATYNNANNVAQNVALTTEAAKLTLGMGAPAGTVGTDWMNATDANTAMSQIYNVYKSKFAGQSPDAAAKQIADSIAAVTVTSSFRLPDIASALPKFMASGQQAGFSWQDQLAMFSGLSHAMPDNPLQAGQDLQTMFRSFVNPTAMQRTIGQDLGLNMAIDPKKGNFIQRAGGGQQALQQLYNATYDPTLPKQTAQVDQGALLNRMFDATTAKVLQDIFANPNWQKGFTAAETPGPQNQNAYDNALKNEAIQLGIAEGKFTDNMQHLAEKLMPLETGLITGFSDVVDALTTFVDKINTGNLGNYLGNAGKGLVDLLTGNTKSTPTKMTITDPATGKTHVVPAQSTPPSLTHEDPIRVGMYTVGAGAALGGAIHLAPKTARIVRTPFTVAKNLASDAGSALSDIFGGAAEDSGGLLKTIATDAGKLSSSLPDATAPDGASIIKFFGGGAAEAGASVSSKILGPLGVLLTPIMENLHAWKTITTAMPTIEQGPAAIGSQFMYNVQHGGWNRLGAAGMDILTSPVTLAKDVNSVMKGGPVSLPLPSGPYTPAATETAGPAFNQLSPMVHQTAAQTAQANAASVQSSYSIKSNSASLPSFEQGSANPTATGNAWAAHLRQQKTIADTAQLNRGGLLAIRTAETAVTNAIATGDINQFNNALQSWQDAMTNALNAFTINQAYYDAKQGHVAVWQEQIRKKSMDVNTMQNQYAGLQSDTSYSASIGDFGTAATQGAAATAYLIANNGNNLTTGLGFKGADYVKQQVTNFKSYAVPAMQDTIQNLDQELQVADPSQVDGILKKIKAAYDKTTYIQSKIAEYDPVSGKMVTQVKYSPMTAATASGASHAAQTKFLQSQAAMGLTAKMTPVEAQIQEDASAGNIADLQKQVALEDSYITQMMQTHTQAQKALLQKMKDTDATLASTTISVDQAALQDAMTAGDVTAVTGYVQDINKQNAKLVSLGKISYTAQVRGQRQGIGEIANTQLQNLQPTYQADLSMGNVSGLKTDILAQNAAYGQLLGAHQETLSVYQQQIRQETQDVLSMIQNNLAPQIQLATQSGDFSSLQSSYKQLTAAIATAMKPTTTYVPTPTQEYDPVSGKMVTQDTYKAVTTKPALTPAQGRIALQQGYDQMTYQPLMDKLTNSLNEAVVNNDIAGKHKIEQEQLTAARGDAKHGTLKESDVVAMQDTIRSSDKQDTINQLTIEQNLAKSNLDYVNQYGGTVAQQDQMFKAYIAAEWAVMAARDKGNATALAADRAVQKGETTAQASTQINRQITNLQAGYDTAVKEGNTKAAEGFLVLINNLQQTDPALQNFEKANDALTTQINLTTQALLPFAAAVTIAQATGNPMQQAQADTAKYLADVKVGFAKAGLPSQAALTAEGITANKETVSAKTTNAQAYADMYTKQGNSQMAAEFLKTVGVLQQLDPSLTAGQKALDAFTNSVDVTAQNMAGLNNAVTIAQATGNPTQMYQADLALYKGDLAAGPSSGKTPTQIQTEGIKVTKEGVDLQQTGIQSSLQAAQALAQNNPTNVADQASVAYWTQQLYNFEVAHAGTLNLTSGQLAGFQQNAVKEDRNTNIIGDQTNVTTASLAVTAASRVMNTGGMQSAASDLYNASVKLAQDQGLTGQNLQNAITAAAQTEQQTLDQIAQNTLSMAQNALTLVSPHGINLGDVAGEKTAGAAYIAAVANDPRNQNNPTAVPLAQQQVNDLIQSTSAGYVNKQIQNLQNEMGIAQLNGNRGLYEDYFNQMISLEQQSVDVTGMLPSQIALQQRQNQQDMWSSMLAGPQLINAAHLPMGDALAGYGKSVASLALPSAVSGQAELIRSLQRTIEQQAQQIAILEGISASTQTSTVTQQQTLTVLQGMSSTGAPNPPSSGTKVQPRTQGLGG